MASDKFEKSMQLILDRGSTWYLVPNLGRPSHVDLSRNSGVTTCLVNLLEPHMPRTLEYNCLAGSLNLWSCSTLRTYN